MGFRPSRGRAATTKARGARRGVPTTIPNVLDPSFVLAQQVAATAGASVHATARAAADLLGASLREHELDLVLLSLAPHFTRGDLAQPAVLHSLEQRRNLREEYAWMGVTDPQGTVVQAVDGILQGQSVAQRPWFIEGQAGLYVGDVHKALSAPISTGAGSRRRYRPHSTSTPATRAPRS